jgi:hypothetical protein
MSEYTRAIFFKDGNCLTITPEEEEGIKTGLRAGGKWIEVQGEFISADNVARVGSHHATTYMDRLEKYQDATELKLKEGEKTKIVIAEPDFYIDEHTGEKMYS